MKPLNKGHFGTSHFVLCGVVVCMLFRGLKRINNMGKWRFGTLKHALCREVISIVSSYLRGSLLGSSSAAYVPLCSIVCASCCYMNYILLILPVVTSCYYLYRHSMTRASIIAILLTFFSIFNIPVFWPILVIYFIVLFTITMKRQIMVSQYNSVWLVVNHTLSSLTTPF